MKEASTDPIDLSLTTHKIEIKEGEIPKAPPLPSGIPTVREEHQQDRENVEMIEEGVTWHAPLIKPESDDQKMIGPENKDKAESSDFEKKAPKHYEEEYQPDSTFLAELMSDTPFQFKSFVDLLKGGPERVTWIFSFLEIEGFSFLLVKFEDIFKMIDHYSTQSTSYNQNIWGKHCLKQLLKMIRIFIMASYTANDTSFLPKLEILRKNSLGM